jgi:tetratricopeptide (TPR) repeat protein
MAIAKRFPKQTARVRVISVANMGAATLLLCLTLLAYFPASNGGLLWDDPGHVTSLGLQSVHGLWRIWWELGATQQYYPLLHSAFWFEHRLWGDTVGGYHLTNIVLHAGSACLLALIVRRLEAPGAWLAAFVFALHPVCVNSVAWISEQKTTLSTVFYLASALTYLNFSQSRRKSRYWLALGLFVLALLSKTVTATLPAALLVVLWWKHRRLTWRADVLPLLPWFALGTGAGLFTVWVERKYIGAAGPEFSLTIIERCLLAGRVIWFYLGKLLWPTDLLFFYPRWKVTSALWWQYLFPLGVAALIAGLWVGARRGNRMSRGALAGFLFFAGTLFPVLGFLNVYPFIYSYVSDHFQYVAGLGIIVPLSSGLTLAIQRASVQARYLERAAPGALLAVLGCLTWLQCGIYRDAETLYRETLARNPNSWLAHNNLGSELMERDPSRVPEALSHFEAALRLQSNYPQIYNNLGIVLSNMPGRLPEAINDFEAAVRLQPNFAQAQNNLGLALSHVSGRLPDAITHFQIALRIQPDYPEAHNNLASALSSTPGGLPAAISEYRAALRLEPGSFAAHYNLANALSSIPGRAAEAISEYQSALRINADYPQAHNNLGIALAGLPDRLTDAIEEYQKALRIQPDFVDAHYNLGIAFSKIPGHLPDAIAQFQIVLKINPDFQPARRILTRIAGSQP